MITLEILKAARAVVKRGWCTGTIDDRHGNHCAIGAIGVAARTRGLLITSAEKELLETILSRHSRGELPPLRFGSCNRPILPVDVECMIGRRQYELIAAFNNSTNKRSVLGLFDETIARLEAQSSEGRAVAELKKAVLTKESVLEPISG